MPPCLPFHYLLSAVSGRIVRPSFRLNCCTPPSPTSSLSSPTFLLGLLLRGKCWLPSWVSLHLSKDIPLPSFLYPHSPNFSRNFVWPWVILLLDYFFKCLLLCDTFTSAYEHIHFYCENKMKCKWKLNFSLVCYPFTVLLYFSKREIISPYSFIWALISHTLLTVFQHGFCPPYILIIFSLEKWILRMDAPKCSHAKSMCFSY